MSKMLKSVGVLFFTVVILVTVMNISSFFFLSMDAWSQFGGLTGVQSIDDWNYPHSRNIDFNHDGKLDLITWTGHACPNTGQVDPMFLYSVCPESKSSIDQQISGQSRHNQHKALLKYIGLDQDSKWVFVEVAVNDVGVFSIKDDGSFDKIDTPTGVYIDSWLYIISHLFIL